MNSFSLSIHKHKVTRSIKYKLVGNSIMSLGKQLRRECQRVRYTITTTYCKSTHPEPIVKLNLYITGSITPTHHVSIATPTNYLGCGLIRPHFIFN